MNEKKRLNDKLLSNLAEHQAKILSNNIQNQEPSAAEQEEINLINELANYLNFDKFNAHETFEIIPGVQLNNGKFIRFFIKEEDITNLADKAEKYEKALGIRFPAQVYQFQTKNLDEKIPGTNTPIPRPKLVAETNNQYEEYLKSIYKNEGISVKAAPDNIGRSPYPHEQINFKKTNKVNSDYYSEYFLNYQSAVRTENLRNQTPQSNESIRKNNRIRSGENLTVKDSELVEKTPLGQKIGHGLTTLQTTTSNPNFWAKFKVAACGLLIATGIGFAIISNPALTAGIAAGAIAVGGGVFLGKKIKNSLSRKINNWLYGKPIETTTDYDGGGEEPTEGISQDYNKEHEKKQAPAQHQSNETQPTMHTNEAEEDTKIYIPKSQMKTNPIINDEPYDPNKKNEIYHQAAEEKTSLLDDNNTTAYEGFINETAQNVKDLRDIKARIKVVEETMKNYEPESSEFLQKLEELEVLEQQENELLSITESLINDVIGTEEVEKEGKSL